MLLEQRSHHGGMIPGELAVDALHGLPFGPLRNYNILAMGLEWGTKEYHDSAVGRGIPPEVVIEDGPMQVSPSTS